MAEDHSSPVQEEQPARKVAVVGGGLVRKEKKIVGNAHAAMILAGISALGTFFDFANIITVSRFLLQ